MIPINTIYKGYSFRSRLEARWGVFLDALEIQWRYEDEGYDCGSAGWYLPDFFLPKEQWIVEVKASPKNASPEEKAKIRALDSDPPDGYKGVIVVGNIEFPNPNWYMKDDFDDADYMGYFLARSIAPLKPNVIRRAVLRARQYRFVR